MTDDELLARNGAMLTQCHPFIREKVAAVLGDLSGHGYRPRIQQAWRSASEQAGNVSRGVSKVSWSYHMAAGAGGVPESLAADLVDDSDPTQAGSGADRFFLMLSGSAWGHGLNTGVLWGLSAGERSVLIAAVSGKDWGNGCALGWDAGHVEVRGISLGAAKRGVRVAP